MYVCVSKPLVQLEWGWVVVQMPSFPNQTVAHRRISFSPQLLTFNSKKLTNTLVTLCSVSVNTLTKLVVKVSQTDCLHLN